MLPEDLCFPNTMTDIDHDTWMLSGTAVMQDGNTVCNDYALNLDKIRHVSSGLSIQLRRFDYVLCLLIGGLWDGRDS